MVWVQIGYPVVIFMAALQRVDPELYEAAEIDGAGWWRRFRAITIPQIRPETFVVALTCTIAALKVFGPIYALTRGGPENATNVPSYFAYFTFFKKLQVGYGAAISTVLTLIIVVVAVAVHPAAGTAASAGTGGSDMAVTLIPTDRAGRPPRRAGPRPAPPRRQPLGRARPGHARPRWSCWCRSCSCCSTRSSRPADYSPNGPLSWPTEFYTKGLGPTGTRSTSRRSCGTRC